MHIILEKNVKELGKEFEFEVSESKLFEFFCNYCIVKKSYLGRFNPSDVTTEEDDASIDGIAFIVDGELISKKEDAEEYFKSHKSNLPVKLILTQVKSGEKFVKKEISNFNVGIKDFLSLEPKLPNGTFNKESIEIFNVIIDNLKKVRNKLPDLEVYYCTSGTYSEEREIKASFEMIEREAKSTDLFREVTVYPMGRSELNQLWNSLNASNEAKLTLREYFGMPEMPNIPQSYVGLINAKEFVDKVLIDSNGNIKNEVFEENIRAYLGENPVNRKIKSTLNNEDKKKLFSVLNNGVTIVTPDLTLTPNTKQIELTNYQIINGCQTSNTLFENYHLLDNNVNVVVKCIESSDGDNITDIISATNSQTDIPEESFFSLTEKSKLIQKFFEIQNSEVEKDSQVYFERRENEFKNEDVLQSRIVDIKSICRSYNAMFLNQPNISSRYVSAIFETQKDKLFQDNDQEVLYYVSALCLCRISSLINQRKHNSHKYRALKWHILYIYKYLVHKSLKDIQSNSNRAKSYCEPIIKSLTSSNKEYEILFQHCYRVIDSIDFPTSDVLKRARFTSDLRDATKKYLKNM